MKAELRRYYGRRWRAVTRPRILARAGNECERCREAGLLDVAHLEIPPGEPGHDDDTNLAALCRKCHRQHDYSQWARKFRSWLEEQKRLRIEAKDAARPLLQAML